VNWTCLKGTVSVGLFLVWKLYKSCVKLDIFPCFSIIHNNWHNFVSLCGLRRQFQSVKGLDQPEMKMLSSLWCCSKTVYFLSSLAHKNDLFCKMSKRLFSMQIWKLNQIVELQKHFFLMSHDRFIWGKGLKWNLLFVKKLGLGCSLIVDYG